MCVCVCVCLLDVPLKNSNAGGQYKLAAVMMPYELPPRLYET